MCKLTQELRSGKVLLMDGAMGTQLMRIGADPEFAFFSEPERVAQIHAWYNGFGARVHLTNTFQVNRLALGEQYTPALHHALWQSAIACCESAASGYTLGDIGPMRGCTVDIARELLRECKGLDGALLETWSSPKDLRIFAEARTRTSPPLLVSFTYWRRRGKGWRTFSDARPETCAKAAEECGAVALGVNCGRNLSMKNMREIVRRYHDACDLPIFVRPNAGTPSKDGKDWHYPGTPDEMTDALGALLEEGVAMVGGCCGTMPKHIGMFREVIDGWNEAR